MYTVEYKLWSEGEIKKIYVSARSKFDAYMKAYYEAIPEENKGELPYSAWVTAVTYQNGNYKTFNTFEGNPF